MNASRLKTFIGIFIVIILTIFLHLIGWLSPIESFARQIVNIGSWSLYNSSISEASQEQKVELTTSTSKIGSTISLSEYLTCVHASTEANVLSEENKELREQLNFLSKITPSHIGADVIGRNIEPIGNTITINRGAESGVLKGEPVIVSGGTLIGKIARVESNMSIVQLINDGESKIAATVINENKSLGIVEGGFGLSVRMTFIPQNETITPGDVIVTSGLEPLIPRGLVIGTIEAVEKEAYQPFQKAVLTPMASLNRLRVVSVLLTSSTSTEI